MTVRAHHPTVAMPLRPRDASVRRADGHPIPTRQALVADRAY
jgi:hypothetical protein